MSDALGSCIGNPAEDIAGRVMACVSSIPFLELIPRNRPGGRSKSGA